VAVPSLVRNSTLAAALTSPVRCTLMVTLPAFSLAW